ncbi:MAG TPA: hypothetical protein VF937_17665 [Chloroflexota bacterium]
MIRKILEAFFRHKLLVLVPPILIPVIVTPFAYLAFPPLYDTWVSVWVDHPAYLNYKDTSNPFNTPVQTQAGRLNELLRTRAFADDVIGRTSLAPLVGTPAGEARISDLINKSVIIGGPTDARAANAEHLLVVHVQASTAQVSYELAKALVDAYQDKTTADQSDQATVALDFYQGRTQDAQQRVSQATQNLRRYVASHQSSDGLDRTTDTSLPATLLDPKLGELQASLQVAQADMNNAQSAFSQAQRDASAAAQGQQLGFQVLDPPELASGPTPQTRKITIFPIAAAVVGLGLSGMLLVMLVATDRTVRSEADLAAGLRVLGTVPMLRLKRLPKELRAVGTRRAIGAVAGAALPAPTGVE